MECTLEGWWSRRRWNGLCGDFKSELVVAFEVKDGEDRWFRTGSFVSISLFKTGRIELLKVKEWWWCFRKEGFSLVALFL
jgi:hypothetical protein